MADDAIIIDYFKSLFSDPTKSRMGKLSNADVEITGELCPRKGKKDQVFFYGTIENDKLTALRYMCALCDPPMFVAADILSRLAVGKTREQVSALGKNEYEKLLGGESAEGLDHFDRARELLVLGMMGQKKI